MTGSPPAIRIADDAALAAIAAERVGFVIDPFNRWWHRASCARVSAMTTGQPKWFAEDPAAVDRFLSERLARYATALPIRPCRTCRPDGAPMAIGDPLRDPEPPPAASESVLAEPVRLRVRQTATGFTACTPHRVTFGPVARSPAHRVRAVLRERLAPLSPRPGETLYAVFSGALPPSSDVENQLIYNVFDAHSTAALARGVRFEFDDNEPRTGFEYRYEIAPANRPFGHWAQASYAVRWSDVELPDGPGDALLARTWWALHAADLDVASPLPARSGFGLRMTIRPPHHMPTLSAERLKNLVDGVVTAFQHHRAPDEAIRRIAARLAVDPDRVHEFISGAARAVLGAAEKPIGLTRAGVQWNPDDTRLVAAEVAIDAPGGEAWLLRAVCSRSTRADRQSWRDRDREPSSGWDDAGGL